MIAGDAPRATSSPPIEEYQLLIGHPPASDFFHFVRTVTLGGEHIDTAELMQDWRGANARVRELRLSEAGLVEGPDCRELPESMQAAAKAALDYGVQRGYRLTPSRWQLVELDRVMVFQKRINLSWAAQLNALLSAATTERALIDFASGANVPRPALRVVRSDDGTYTLSCSSGELRFVGSQMLDPATLPEPHASGNWTHVIGLFLGTGFNFVSALRYRNRLILTNGTHRAYALRMRGHTHAPCLVIDVDHEDDLDLAGVRDVRSQIERYVRAPRPPLFKDYFDAALRKLVQVPRSEHAVQIQISARSLRIPAGA